MVTAEKVRQNFALIKKIKYLKRRQCEDLPYSIR